MSTPHSELQIRSAEEFFAVERQEHYDQANAILTEQRTHVLNLDKDQVNWDVDAVSYARRYLTLRDSAQKAEAWEAVKRNSSFTLHEALSKYEPEVFEPITGYYDEENQDVILDGYGSVERAAYGISAIAVREMQQRSLVEFVESATVVDVIKKGLWREYDVYTFSPCGEYDGPHSDFVHDIKKGMVRSWRFFENEDGSIQVRSQTIAIDGQLLDHELFSRIMESENALEHGQPLAGPTEVLAFQQLVPVGRFETELDYIAWLDSEIAQREQKAVRLGRIATSQWDKEHYQEFATESMQRREKIEEYSGVLALKMLDIARVERDEEAANRKLRHTVTRLLAELFQDEPELSSRSVDAETAAGYRKAYELWQNGDYRTAGALYKELKKALFEQVNYCGVGSCGLEEATSSMVLKAVQAGLGRDVLHFKDGTCAHCGNKGYLVDSDGKKLCLNGNCGKTDGRTATINE